MANARIKFKIGNIEFVGEGEQDWVTEQLDKVLERIPSLATESKKIAPKAVVETPQVVKTTPKIDSSNLENLSTFLRKRDAIDKQRRRFLGTAVWLQLKGQQMIKTKEVTDALRAARQIKITNPSHQLNQNISQGFCQKEGQGFYVTPQGVENII
ncbi:MAG: hypothetical protein COA67_06925 [Lutibacter sp.]|nr:MAG: hypothetical protein COA67_06925 [Lutibacter sp.]